MTLNYKITDITDGIATVEYGDGSRAQIGLRADMTPAELDALAYAFGPKRHETPDFAKAGTRRVAQPVPAPAEPAFDSAAYVAGLDAQAEARVARNQRLSATDHFALSDRALSPAMAAYRQALRDLPRSTAWDPRLRWDEATGVVLVGVSWPEQPA